ncbi:MAG: antitoxin [Acidimicrobiia bacterium]|nr:antitoxin [Acidimicrobiia bacterium]
MLTRRLQVLIDDDRLHRLEREAARRQVAGSVLVRDAIDAAFPATSAARRAAGDRVLEPAAMPVPEPDDLRVELEELRGRRA